MANHDPFPAEQAHVAKLLAALRMTTPGFSNPNVKHDLKTGWKHTHETGADVSFAQSSGITGVQVTEIDGGEPYSRGQLRAQETHFDPTRPYTMFGNNNPTGAITAAVIRKIERSRRYNFDEFDKVWLLIVGNLVQPLAVASTFLLPAAINLNQLNAVTGGALKESKYERVFVHLGFGKALYQWTRSRSWETLIEPEDWSQPPGYDFWSIQAMMRRR